MTTANLDADFYTAILADPKDNTVRLVYADYLDRIGQSDRATFIRLQIEIATSPCAWGDVGGPSCDEWQLHSKRRCSVCRANDDRRKRARKLLRHHIVDWLRPIGPPFIPAWADRLDWQPPKKPGARNGGLVGYELVGDTLVLQDGAEHDIELTFARGFPSHLACSFDRWAIRVCATCNGSGRVGRHWDPASDTMRGGQPCPDCPNDDPGLVPGLCEAIAWRPDWTVQCRQTDYAATEYHIDCARCGGSGRLPATRAPYAMPLESVALKTLPIVHYYGGFARLYGYALRIVELVQQWPAERPGLTFKLMAAEWPGLTFTLPPEEPDPQEDDHP